jgi:uncharacterized membrane protein YeaQ/YmgE (transglycosylase-associated protein family)
MTNQIVQNTEIGWRLGSTGFNFIKDHKATLLFSFFSGCLFALTLLFFAIPFIGVTITENSLSHHWVLGFLFLFLTTVFSTWMKVSLSIYTNAIFENNPISTITSAGRALSRLFAIIEWAFVDAVVGTIVRALRTKNNNEGFLASILSRLLGAALELGWNVLSFFVIPLLAFENLSLFKTIEESGTILKKTWGESAGASFNIGFMGIGWLFGWYLLFFGPLTIYCKYFLEQPVMPEKAIFIITIGVLAFVVPLLIMAIVISSVKIIVKTALFNYTRNKSTGPFETDLLKISFASPTNTH